MFVVVRLQNVLYQYGCIFFAPAKSASYAVIEQAETYAGILSIEASRAALMVRSR